MELPDAETSVCVEKLSLELPFMDALETIFADVDMPAPWPPVIVSLPDWLDDTERLDDAEAESFADALAESFADAWTFALDEASPECGFTDMETFPNRRM